MSFSSDWLRLRAPADDRARDPALRAAAAAAVRDRDRDRDAPLIVDLGAGSGASFRALSPHLPAGARWRLIDNDARLLAEAKARAGPAAVETRAADLADPNALAAALEGADLVTASAFFDLVSAAWVATLLDALPASAALYAALTYDGREDWRPAATEDASALALFHADMRRDKGFGPALGPDASEALTAALSARGRPVAVADSAWRLEAPRDAALIDALAGSTADALTGAIARGAGAAAPIDATLWRRRPRSTVLIGHCDHFAAAAAP